MARWSYSCALEFVVFNEPSPFLARFARGLPVYPDEFALYESTMNAWSLELLVLSALSGLTDEMKPPYPGI